MRPRVTTALREGNKPVLPSLLQAGVDEFAKWWQAKQSAAGMAEKILEPLYHYTDAGGLKGIVENQEIWFTSVLHLNDPSEINYGIDAAKQELRELVNQSGGNEFLKEFCNHIEFLITHNRHAVFGFFVASFSRSADELGQWRAYGDDGRGFAVGLNPRLFQTTDTPDTTKPEKNVFVASVSYGERNARMKQREALQRAIAIMQKIVSTKNGRMLMAKNETEFNSKMCMEIAVPMLWNSVTTKHDAYAAEREVRLIILGDLARFTSIETRVRNGDLVPFVRSCMSTHKEGDIVRVMIGPAAEPIAEDAVDNLLKTKGIDPVGRVCRSKIPYRSLRR
jgi:hypothetical protein